MEIYTNMAWPDDPYRTGQQLYPRPAPRLAAFTLESSPARGSLMTTSAAIVYLPLPLPLHRTRPVTVTGQTLTFGFRAASITGDAEADALAAVADLDLTQARRHAAILTGCMLSSALADLQMLAGITLRGLSAVQEEWACRHTLARGRADMFDCPADLPGQPFLEDACHHNSPDRSSPVRARHGPCRINGMPPGRPRGCCGPETRQRGEINGTAITARWGCCLAFLSIEHRPAGANLPTAIRFGQVRSDATAGTTRSRGGE